MGRQRRMEKKNREKDVQTRDSVYKLKIIVIIIIIIIIIGEPLWILN